MWTFTLKYNSRSNIIDDKLKDPCDIVLKL